MKLAPVILFCYNRPLHTLECLKALSLNELADQTELFVFCDGPKADVSDEQMANITEVRRVVRSKAWCSKVTVIESESNKGLADSVIAGVTEIVNRFGNVIVLEDDLVTSRFFLQYMNAALNKYKDAENVMVVSGHQFPVKEWNTDYDAFFLPFSTSWGWGTWNRAWKLFDPHAVGNERLAKEDELRYRFDLNGAYPYSLMLEKQMRHGSQVDSWAVRWWWSVFVHNGLALFPVKSMVFNIGFDASATHTKVMQFETPEFDVNNRVNSLPDSISVDVENLQRLSEYIAGQKSSAAIKHPKLVARPSVFRRILNLVFRFDN